MKNNQLLMIGLIEVMEAAIGENNREVFFNKFYQIRNLKADFVSDNLLGAYKSLLLKSIDHFKRDNSFNTIASSIISLSYGLVPTDKLDTELLKVLNDCLELTDTRIKANALTAICEFDPHSELFKEHIHSKFNRIAAEALIAEGKRKLNAKIFDKLKEFFISSNPFFVASGIYVVGQLMEHYEESLQDVESIFQSDFEFFVKKIQVFSNHPHEMVRKRAIMTKKLIESQAAKKTA